MLPTLSRLCRAPHLSAPPVISACFLVKCDAYGRLDQLYYLALGHHELFIVDHDLGTIAEGVGVLAMLYTSIDHISLDPEDFELFRLEMSAAPRVVYARKPGGGIEIPTPSVPHVSFRCVERRRVVDEMIVALKTDYMFQTWEVCADVVERIDKVAWGGRRGANRNLIDSFAVTSQHEKRESLQSYFFFRPNDYKPSTNERKGSHKLVFELLSDPEKPDVDAASLHVTVVDPTGERALSVQALCERSLREWCASCQEWKLLGKPTAYVKKMNLTGDPAAWTCFEMRVRTYAGQTGARRFEYRDVTAIAARRSFIPPTMLDKRDFVVFHVSARKDFASAGHLIAERVVDSLSPEATGFDCDSLLVQAACDALLLDGPAYAWFAASLHIYPKAHDLAMEYCSSLVAMLAKVGAVEEKVSGTGTQPRGSISLEAPPFRSPSDIAEDAERLPESSNEAERRSWKVRVRRYFAYCVDGGLLPGVLSLNELARQWRVAPEKKFKAEMGGVIEWLLNFRRRGYDCEPEPAFSVKATDDGFMRSCSFDEVVMARLLEAGFVQAALEETGDPSVYPRFMVRLLRIAGDSEENTEMLRYAVVKRLVEQSANASHDSVDDVIDDVALNHLVPVLVNVLVNYPQDDKLRVLAVATLVNFSHKNRSVKASILAGGTSRILVDLLRSPNEDLVRHTCSLLTNLTKAPEFRANVAKGLAIPLLLSLLERKRYAPHFRSPAIIAQAASVLGNLAIDGDLRMLILGSGERSDDSIPNSLRLLAHFFLTPAQELCRDMGCSQREREAVLTASAFALKNLAVSASSQASSAKRTLARLALRNFVDVLRDGKDGKLVDVVLRLLHVLAFDAKVAQRMIDDNVPALLEKHKSDFPELVLQLNSKLDAVRQEDNAPGDQDADDAHASGTNRPTNGGTTGIESVGSSRALGGGAGGGGARISLKGVLRGTYSKKGAASAAGTTGPA